MINPKLLRDNPEVVRQSLSARGEADDCVAAYLDADKKWRDALAKLESDRHSLKESTPKSKPSPDQIVELKKLSNAIKLQEEGVRELELAARTIALGIPNIVSSDVPVGASEADNVELERHGQPRDIQNPRSHEEIAESLSLIDFERAAKISGSRFSVLTGLGARLERALINFMLDRHSESGYTEMMPPALVRDSALLGTGQLPKFHDDLFHTEGQQFWLSPTGEVQLTNLVANEILDEQSLPVKWVAWTPCFRKEAGSYGKDIKGIIRQHQFNKVELVKVVKPETAEAELESLVSDARSILDQLELPYRTVQLCTGDVGFSAGKTIDIEVWFPSQKRYREISSCSNFLDFQARRAMIRYRNSDSKNVEYAATLNGSGLAVGRTLAAILENYQQDDGSVEIPSALQPYMGTGRIS